MISKEEILAALKAIDPDAEGTKCVGICACVARSFPVDGYFRLFINDVLKPYFKRWPEYAGDETYPVPHPGMDSARAYNTSVRMFNEHTEYGRARRRLLTFLIEELEKELGQETGA